MLRTLSFSNIFGECGSLEEKMKKERLVTAVRKITWESLANIDNDGIHHHGQLVLSFTKLALDS